MATLSGCAGGFDLDSLSVDRSLVTSSVGGGQGAPTSAEASDMAAIRSTIAAWDRSRVPDDVVPWANLDTGSAGAIQKVEDVIGDEAFCRRFRATRDSFSGDGAYRGEACRTAGAGWTVTELKKR